MRKIPVLALLFIACIDIPTGLNDHIDLLTEGGEVASVVCAPAALEIAANERGECSAFNAARTVIEIDGFAPVLWVSDDPQAVSITSNGEIFTGSTVNASVTITATGTNGSTASFVVSSF